jgi:hypothetical protein
VDDPGRPGMLHAVSTPSSAILALRSDAEHAELVAGIIPPWPSSDPSQPHPSARLLAEGEDGRQPVLGRHEGVQAVDESANEHRASRAPR